MKTKSRFKPLSNFAALGAFGAILCAGIAIASITLPGVGVVVKKKPGDAPIIVSADGNGQIRLSGLEAGDYSVKPIGAASETNIAVGPNGQMALAVRHRGPKGGGRDKIDTGRRAKSSGEITIETIAFDAPHNLQGQRSIKAGHYAVSNFVEINKVGEIAMAALSDSPETINAMLNEKIRAGDYRDIYDFAQRLCPKYNINLTRSIAKIGDTTIIFGEGGANPGFSCGPREPNVFYLYGRRHNYVGHVTLLR